MADIKRYIKTLSKVTNKRIYILRSTLVIFILPFAILLYFFLQSI